MSTTKRSCALLAAGALIVAGAVGADLDSLWSGAVETDVQLQILELTHENRELSVQRANLPARLSVSVGTGQTGGLTVGRTFGDDPLTSVGADPSVTVALGESLETQVRVGADLSLTARSSGTDYALRPSVGVTQPLNPILGLQASEEPARLSDYHSIVQSEINIAGRIYAVRRNVLGALRSLVGLRKSIGDQERALERSVHALTRETTLQTHGPDSAALKRLEYAVENAERNLAFNSAQYERAWEGLERLTGMELDELPPSLPEAVLRVPQESFVERSPTVFLARLNLQRQRARLAELVRGHIPQYTAGASYNSVVSSDPDAAVQHRVGGSFSAALKNATVSTALSTNITNQSLDATVRFSWSLPDDRAERIDTQSARNTVRSGELELESAVSSVRLSFQDFGFSLMELANRRDKLRQDIAVAELHLEETRMQHDRGLITDDELKNALWALESLRYDEWVLEIDELVFDLDVEAATFMDVEG